MSLFPEIHRGCHEQPVFPLKQGKLPCSDLQKFMSNVANLSLPVPSLPAFDGKPGIVWITYIPISFLFTIEMPPAITEQLFFTQPHCLCED